MISEEWEPTKHGGFRRTRTGVAQRKSAAQITRRPVPRKHPPVLIRLCTPGWVLIRWGERLGLPTCPYAIRWRLELPFGSLRVHHWLAPDDSRAFHDHPWWFLTLVMRGGYTDRSIAGEDHLRAGSIRYRPALHRHTVYPGTGGAWTLLITGPPARSWGFWPNGKFRKANKWFLTYGHHPCD